MSRIGVVGVAALVLAACRDGSGGVQEKPGEDVTVAVTGVVSGVDEHNVQVTTDDGRRLALRMGRSVSVTLAGGEAETAVITEGAPVRVSYRPRGSGGELVTIDVEPRAASARGETPPAPQGEPSTHPDRVQQGR